MNAPLMCIKSSLCLLRRRRASADDVCLPASVTLSGIGSLKPARLRLAGAEQVIELTDDVEILTLAGSLAANGSHLHFSVSDRQGRVLGGHVAPGCIVHTTAVVCGAATMRA